MNIDELFAALEAAHCDTGQWFDPRCRPAFVSIVSALADTMVVTDVPLPGIEEKKPRYRFGGSGPLEEEDPKARLAAALAYATYSWTPHRVAKVDTTPAAMNKRHSVVTDQVRMVLGSVARDEEVRERVAQDVADVILSGWTLA